MNNNKTKVITIAALVIAVIALSIGFAAFSSTLNIQTGASVTPNDTFVVKFSKENGSLVDDQPVTASDGSQYGGSATINNSDVKNPKIDNLSASFTAPGQSVTYTFYVRNMGDFDAYLTDVRFNNAEGKQVFQSCTSSGANPGTQTIVNDVCNDITFTLELEDTPNKVLTSESNFATEVGNDYKVLKSTTPNTGTTNSKMVKVTIAYPNKDGVHYADGSFTVNFGSVEMIFATLAGYIPPTPTPATSEVAVDNLIPTEIEIEEADIIEEGFYSFIGEFGESSKSLLYFESVISLETEEGLYVWHADSAAASIVSLEQGITILPYKWYKDDGGYQLYTGPSPISLNDFEASEIKSESYINRVIASFGN